MDWCWQQPKHPDQSELTLARWEIEKYSLN